MKECLTGTAQYEIAHIDFFEEQYEAALNRIHDVYGNKEDAEEQHLKELSNLSNATELHKVDNIARQNKIDVA